MQLRTEHVEAIIEAFRHNWKTLERFSNANPVEYNVGFTVATNLAQHAIGAVLEQAQILTAKSFRESCCAGEMKNPIAICARCQYANIGPKYQCHALGRFLDDPHIEIDFVTGKPKGEHNWPLCSDVNPDGQCPYFSRRGT